MYEKLSVLSWYAVTPRITVKQFNLAAIKVSVLKAVNIRY